MKTQRDDTAIVKWIHSFYGPQHAAYWQSAPYVELGKDIPSYLPAETTDVLGDENMPLPWNLFTISVYRGGSDTPAVMMVSKEMPTRWMGYPPERLDMGVKCISSYVSVPSASGMLVGIIGRNTAGKPSIGMVGPHEFMQEQEKGLKYLNTATHAAYRLVHYLLQSPKHMTEVVPANPRVTPKTIKLKPWVRDDLPRIILLDPTTAARTYGMPTGKTITERNAPIPHGRRGHWRRLDDDRRTWVRPSWIGPTSWESKGQIYRVMTPPQDA